MGTNGENNVAKEVTTCRVIDVAKVAEEFVNNMKARIQKDNLKPKLVGFLANKDQSAVAYARWTKKNCEHIGIEFELRVLKREDLEEAILAANKEKSVHGIMVYYPVFGGGHDQYLQNLVSVYKDCEGLSHLYRFNMYHNIRFLDNEKTLKCIIPCTPLAMIKILEYVGIYNKALESGNQLSGRTISIVNRSEVVGRPLAALLANDGAKVYSIDVNDVLEFHRSNDARKHYVTETSFKLEDCLPLSDVVITGVPSPNFKINVDLCKKGFCAINFSSSKNFGDEVLSKASIFVGSIGKVTCACLNRNLMRLYDYQISHKLMF